MVPSVHNWNFSLLATSKSIHSQNSQYLIKSEFAQIIRVKPVIACSPPHSKIIYPNQTDSDTDFRHTTTPTYDARTLFLFNSKIIYPNQSDSNTSSSIQQAQFLPSPPRGPPTQSQWVQQRLLADSLMRDKLHKKYREC